MAAFLFSAFFTQQSCHLSCGGFVVRLRWFICRPHCHQQHRIHFLLYQLTRHTPFSLDKHKLWQILTYPSMWPIRRICILAEPLP